MFLWLEVNLWKTQSTQYFPPALALVMSIPDHTKKWNLSGFIFKVGNK